jgi:hypothetical protein
MRIVDSLIASTDSKKQQNIDPLAALKASILS